MKTAELTVQLPAVHINGTAAKSLLEMNRSAMSAVSEAYRAVQRAAPHARDYYVQGPEAWKRAHDEHVDRLIALEKVRKELEVIALHVIDSGKAE